MTKKILLVEDTLEALHNLRDLLSMEGFEITTAVDGADAIHQLHRAVPDLIITDLRMPKVDGFTLIEKLRRTHQLSSIPVIIFSANATPENETRSRQLGVCKFLKKPSSIETILESIHAVLELEA
jgi:DNA-binding response OmpR family regulator